MAQKKEVILDLTKHFGKQVRVKFNGGREATGILKGHDSMANLVLDEAVEYLRDPEDPYKIIPETRKLGLVVCRGTSVVLICPQDGFQPIENPFAQDAGLEAE